MRVLPICFMALFMAGCTSLTTQVDKAEKQHQSIKKSNAAYNVRLYTKTDELSGSPFKDLGIVAGESCRNTLQDPPASIEKARQGMLTKAASLNANAVLLHQCAILSGQGCYQVAVCEGSALLTTNN
ncbi:Rcs stress response system protein RcsF [Xenorhabdus sp. 12]|uniref:Outer membrane lipoprotein RcsF n=1 Tax=Xenorhabdus santafensis TaxID=2582833 RepID=A0ABU4SAY8_9GAMM|nr:Rcs stress response system protein RcsF [Xenorhabdus sp. 12]MDX7987911.1 Rcs stress response system protein RcsF [Xenorhabdus sp. 12]